MAEIFFKRQGLNDSGDAIDILHKATYDDGPGLKVYANLADSNDDGVLYMTQPKSPYHRDSAAGPADENGIIPRDIVEYNRAWDSAGEAFRFAKEG